MTWLRVKNAGKRADQCERSVRKWLKKGLRHVRLPSGTILIKAQWLDEFLEGFEVARKIREELKLKTLPIIMLTAVHEVKRVPYRFAPHEQWLPVDYFFEKPVESKVLVLKIKEILNIPTNI